MVRREHSGDLHTAVKCALPPSHLITVIYRFPRDYYWEIILKYYYCYYWALVKLIEVISFLLPMKLFFQSHAGWCSLGCIRSFSLYKLCLLCCCFKFPYLLSFSLFYWLDYKVFFLWNNLWEGWVRVSCIICGAQCKMIIWGILLKNF